MTTLEMENHRLLVRLASALSEREEARQLAEEMRDNVEFWFAHGIIPMPYSKGFPWEEGEE